MTDDLVSLSARLRELEQALAEHGERARSTRDELRRREQRWIEHVNGRRREQVRAIGEAEGRLEELVSALEQLEGAARSILTSRRWRLANFTGQLLDRLRRAHAPGKEHHRLRAAIDHAASLVEDAGAPLAMGDSISDPHIPEPPPPVPGGDAAGDRAHFSDFGGYLRTAVTDPILPAPYDEPARRVVGVMDSFRRARVLAAQRDEQLDRVKVSVTLPLRDDSPAVDQAIKQVVAQTHDAWELLLVGPKAQVAAERWVARDGRIVAVPETTEDPWHARNVATRAATGSYIAHLDLRTHWHADFLRVLVHELRSNPGTGLVYSAQQLVRGSGHDGEGVSTLVGLRFAPYNRSLLENRGIIGLSSVLHDRSLTEGEAFDPDMGELAGRDLLMRFSERSEVLAVPCLLGTTDVSETSSDVEVTARGDLQSRGEDTDHLTPLLQRFDRAHSGEALSIPGLEAIIDQGQRPCALPIPLRRGGAPRSTAIVIPSYQAARYLEVCVAALFAYTPTSQFQLIIVDNNSDEETWEIIERYADHEAVSVIANDRNLGFTQAVNQGIEAAGELDVVLLNNDAVVTPGWLEAMWAVLDEVPRTGLVVPRQVMAPGGTTGRKHVPCADIDRELDVNLSSLYDNVEISGSTLPSGYHLVSFAPFFCTYIPRTTIELIGPLNIEHGPHYRSDRIFAYTAHYAAGLRAVYTPASKVYHFRHRATRELKEQDPEMFDAMFRSNDLMAITRAQDRPPS